MAELTQELLLSLFAYRDGNLFRKVHKSQNAQIDDLAGHAQKRGYRLIRINNKYYYAHRLIFLYHHGFLPQFLDHIDGDPANNDISNIREATKQENNRNKKKTKSVNGKPTSSDFKGVYWSKNNKNWVSQITINRRTKHLGNFTSEIDAAKAYNIAAAKHFGEYACLNIIPNLYNPLQQSQ